jgi:hypothetical protein
MNIFYRTIKISGIVAASLVLLAILLDVMLAPQPLMGKDFYAKAFLFMFSLFMFSTLSIRNTLKGTNIKVTYILLSICVFFSLAMTYLAVDFALKNKIPILEHLEVIIGFYPLFLQFFLFALLLANYKMTLAGGLAAVFGLVNVFMVIDAFGAARAQALPLYDVQELHLWFNGLFLSFMLTVIFLMRRHWKWAYLLTGLGLAFTIFMIYDASAYAKANNIIVEEYNEVKLWTRGMFSVILLLPLLLVRTFLIRDPVRIIRFAYSGITFVISLGIIYFMLMFFWEIRLPLKIILKS